MLVHNKTVIQSEFLFVVDGEVVQRAPFQIPLDRFSRDEFAAAFEKLLEARDEWEVKCQEQSGS